MDKLVSSGLWRLLYGVLLLVMPVFTGYGRSTWFALILLFIALVEGLSWWLKERRGEKAFWSLFFALASGLFGLLAFIPVAAPLIAWLVTFYLAFIALAELALWLKNTRRLWLLYSGSLLVLLALITRLTRLADWVTLVLALGLLWSGCCRLVASLTARRAEKTVQSRVSVAAEAADRENKH